MIVIGIDPGLAITGCAVITEGNNKQSLLFSTSITTRTQDIFPARLSAINEKLQKIIKKYHPDIAVLENLFFNTNAKTAFLVGQSRGIIQLALYQNHVPVIEYTPLQVKIALTGYTRAEKKQIQSMVSQILKLPAHLSPDDVADAAAIALTHCFSYKINSKITSI